MVHQSVLDKHSNQYYSVGGRMKQHNKSNSLSPDNSVGNIQNLHAPSIQNGNNKKIAIYDFPTFDCKWHQCNEFHVIAPANCIQNETFQTAFPFATFYSYNPMI